MVSAVLLSVLFLASYPPSVKHRELCCQKHSVCLLEKRPSASSRPRWEISEWETSEWMRRTEPGKALLLEVVHRAAAHFVDRSSAEGDGKMREGDGTDEKRETAAKELLARLNASNISFVDDLIKAGDAELWEGCNVDIHDLWSSPQMSMSLQGPESFVSRALIRALNVSVTSCFEEVSDEKEGEGVENLMERWSRALVKVLSQPEYRWRHLTFRHRMLNRRKQRQRDERGVKGDGYGMIPRNSNLTSPTSFQEKDREAQTRGSRGQRNEAWRNIPLSFADKPADFRRRFFSERERQQRLSQTPTDVPKRFETSFSKPETRAQSEDRRVEMKLKPRANEPVEVLFERVGRRALMSQRQMAPYLDRLKACDIHDTKTLFQQGRTAQDMDGVMQFLHTLGVPSDFAWVLVTDYLGLPLGTRLDFPRSRGGRRTRGGSAVTATVALPKEQETRIVDVTEEALNFERQLKGASKSSKSAGAESSESDTEAASESEREKRQQEGQKGTQWYEVW
uniref:Uncharacterized protein n=1 Tax=Chromera velia CCMP2878 TaxID=1169474 RepID=A0A0G4HEI5_9ALVE|mmetsp:Transcript_43415/g.85673  ORF Transcript_43415/g.85673 Transcript_43415/m.85673 type:complete len:509 (+) Transcript_43415:217-1743(+)|eukprot:Cvel_26642.t1-p1 / transcript=Cvel_26642.t1 / gene=Cvel_26642 / organism=Chromera_velia_CCMP2878 / gene_product=hypothetical protein / transcript_product=hypothetical protein / location=Cvel_scaffold3204:978-2962(-) / protein_length=508 / sequence_SO=supercontig / SO=protein_coding / is_pseudo=false